MENTEKQRIMPTRLPDSKSPEVLQPDKIHQFLPNIRFSPESPNQFSIYLPGTEEILSEYLLNKEEADAIAAATGGTSAHPIYFIPPETAPVKDELYNLHVEIVAAPPREKFAWRKTLGLKEIRKEEKDEKKRKLNAEIALIPKEEIWNGFRSIKHENGTHDQPEGYRPSKDTKKWWMPGVGNPWGKIWIIGLYPSTEEAKAGHTYAGGSGEELFRTIQEAGLDLHKDVYLDNIIKRYMPGKTKIGAELKLEQMWLLRRQLSYYQPERIICLGAEVFKELLGNDYSFKNMRATWIDAKYPNRQPEPNFPAWKGRVAGTFHPAGCLRPEGRHNLPLFRHDLKELLLDKEQQDFHPESSEIRTIPELENWIRDEMAFLDSLPENEFVICPLDTEGYGGIPEEDEFVSIQLGYVLCKKLEKQPNYSEAVKGTWIPSPTFELEPVMCSKQVTNLLFREHPDPEHIDKAVFQFSDQQALNLFETKPETPSPQNEMEAEEEKEPIFELALTAEDRAKIIQKHGERRKDRDLVLFCPYLTKEHLGGKAHIVGPLIQKLIDHPKVAGFVLTNANYDRIRLARQLNIDLSRASIFKFPLDTMLGEHVADENGDLGLKPCLNKHFGWARQDRALDLFSKHYHLDRLCKKMIHKSRRNEWSLYPWSLLSKYAAKDVYGCGELLVAQYRELCRQESIYQEDRLLKGNSNTLRQAFYISCGAINGTYQMHDHGMPVGKEGFKILTELTHFYKGHESKLIKEYQEMVYALTGFRDANPSSPEELGFILYNPKSPISRRGIEPWKESGQKGRLWEEIPSEERANCKASTDAESLEIIASNCEDPDIQKFLVRLSEIKTILTIREDFLPDIGYGMDKKKGIIGRLNFDTMHLHTSYTPTLDTARCRSVPNLSTFPKLEVKRVKKILGVAPPYQIREIIHAPEGALLLNRDWKTAEVLALGYLSGDLNMMQIIAQMSQGLDFHCKLAIPSYPIIGETINLIWQNPEPPTDWLNANMPEEKRKEFVDKWVKFAKIRKEAGREGPLSTGESHQMTVALYKQERSNIKPVTFGVPYGRSAKAIMKQLNREYYVEDLRGPDGNIIKVTLAEAQAMIDSYKITEFSTAWGYLEDQAKQAVEKGYLRDPWGYIRHFPHGMKPDEITRKAYNYQIQHLVAAVMNIAMPDWVRRKEMEKLKSYAYATLYDNIGWVVFEDEYQKVWDLSQTIMTTERPVGPKDGDKPELADWHFPTDGEFTKTWEGKVIPLEELGVKDTPSANLTGLEGKI